MERYEEEQEEEEAFENFEDYEEYADDFDVPLKKGRSSGGGGCKKAKTKSKVDKSGKRFLLAPPPALSVAECIKLDPEMNEIAVKQAVKTFKMRSVQSKQIDIDLCKPILVLVLQHLKQKYASLFKDGHSSYVELHRVELLFSEHTSIHCKPWTGKIEFGLKTIKDEMYDGCTSRYQLENFFMYQVCKCKEDVLLWFLLHEFVHLFKEHWRHNQAFFERVLLLAKQNMFLFQEPPPVNK